MRCFCGCFEKHSRGKHKENVRTVYKLILTTEIIMALSSEYGCLKTLLATRSVFSFKDGGLLLVLINSYQPQNAAVLKCSRPRTSDTAIWASNSCWTIFLGSSLRSVPFSLTLCCTTAWNNSVDLPRGTSVLAYTCMTAWIFDSLNYWCIKGLYCCTSMTWSKSFLLQDLFGDNILTQLNYMILCTLVILLKY